LGSLADVKKSEAELIINRFICQVPKLDRIGFLEDRCGMFEGGSGLFLDKWDLAETRWGF
jgi:hypothetical protein